MITKSRAFFEKNTHFQFPLLYKILILYNNVYIRIRSFSPAYFALLELFPLSKGFCISEKTLLPSFVLEKGLQKIPRFLRHATELYPRMTMLNGMRM